MNELQVLRRAFLDELEKVAASMSRMRSPQTRAGRRPLRVSTLLKKEKDGTLWKPSVEAEGLPSDLGSSSGT